MTLTLARRLVGLLLLGITFCAISLAQDSPGSDQPLSLADQARKSRKDRTKEIQMSEEDAKKLFESVDGIFDFAAQDSGFPKRDDVKRRLVGADEVEKYTRQQEAKNDYAKRFLRSELTMKKFGLLPRDFNMAEFLVKANGKQIAAYYDFDTKTISMLNWIPLDKQAPILAHELTHALQDQNYGLKAWLKIPDDANPNRIHTSEEDARDDSPTARRAVVEGQAQVVFVDYLLQPLGRTLQTAPGLLYQMEDPAVKAVADSEMLHNAPMIVREMGTFPYSAGVIFEGELLQKGGKPLAFAGTFARPPRNTHEILQPKAYLDQEKVPTVNFPDLAALLGKQYSVYDSGGIGELDMRALIKQYGDRKSADEISSDWMGARYVAFRKASDSAVSKDPSVSDLALLFVSRWKSVQSAQRFAKIYVGAVNQRYATATAQPLAACQGSQCPVAAASFSTDEGPVLVNQWPDNTVVVCESFDQASASRLLIALGDGSAVHADYFRQDELGLRLLDVPGFSMFQQRIGEKTRELMQLQH